MRTISHIILVLFISHVCHGYENTQLLDKGPKPVANIGFDNSFRLGFGINNFGMDYTFGVRFFDKFSLGAGAGFKTLKAPIFTNLGFKKEPKIGLINFPVYLHASVNIFENGNFKTYGYGMFGRAFYTSNEDTSSDKSLKSIYAEAGIGVKWSKLNSSFGFEIGQFYTNAKGTARVDYLDSDAFVDYNLEIFNISLNITYSFYF